MLFSLFCWRFLNFVWNKLTSVWNEKAELRHSVDSQTSLPYFYIIPLLYIICFINFRYSSIQLNNLHLMVNLANYFSKLWLWRHLENYIFSVVKIFLAPLMHSLLNFFCFDSTLLDPFSFSFLFLNALVIFWSGNSLPSGISDFSLCITSSKAHSNIRLKILIVWISNILKVIHIRVMFKKSVEVKAVSTKT